jgi:hypothetical protein
LDGSCIQVRFEADKTLENQPRKLGNGQNREIILKIGLLGSPTAQF